MSFFTEFKEIACSVRDEVSQSACQMAGDTVAISRAMPFMGLTVAFAGAAVVGGAVDVVCISIALDADHSGVVRSIGGVMASGLTVATYYCGKLSKKFWDACEREMSRDIEVTFSPPNFTLGL